MRAQGTVSQKGSQPSGERPRLHAGSARSRRPGFLTGAPPELTIGRVASPVCLKEPCARAASGSSSTHSIEPDASRATPRSTLQAGAKRLRPEGACSLTGCPTDCGLSSRRPGSPEAGTGGIPFPRRSRETASPGFLPAEKDFVNLFFRRLFTPTGTPRASLRSIAGLAWEELR